VKRWQRSSDEFSETARVAADSFRGEGWKPDAGDRGGREVKIEEVGSVRAGIGRAGSRGPACGAERSGYAV